jgi:CheY-like chemotaxis protein
MARRALIVDDSKLARMNTIKTLNGLDEAWDCVEATNAEEAMDRAKSGAFDVALLDFNMPGRDGLALAVELGELYPQMRLVIVSANSQLEVMARCEALGAIFVAKPFRSETMAAALPLRQPG